MLTSETMVSADTSRMRAIALMGFLLAANASAWIWACMAFHHYPQLMGMALLAYGFGLRHAVDADHIAAIDNVTRALMQKGKRPVGTGFFFALGHSTIVVAASVGVALTAAGFQARLATFHVIGSVIGTAISVSFLLAIALMNMVVLAQVYRVFRRVRTGWPPDTGTQLETHGNGILSRLLRPLFKIVAHGWQMYPIGFLFGLGFDTATEIGLLGMSASQTAKGLPFWSVLVFPALFTCAMSLVDTADGLLMMRAYGWAFISPMRKLYYNLAITSVSVAVALLVGGIEALGMIEDRFNSSGAFWNGVNALNDHFGLIGYAIICIFLAGWLISIFVYRFHGDAPRNRSVIV